MEAAPISGNTVSAPKAKDIKVKPKKEKTITSEGVHFARQLEFKPIDFKALKENMERIRKDIQLVEPELIITSPEKKAVIFSFSKVVYQDKRIRWTHVDRGENLTQITIDYYLLSEEQQKDSQLVEKHVSAVYQANRNTIGSDRNLIQPGMILHMPDVEE